MYWTEDFNGWVNSIIPDKMPKSVESRIVIPFFSMSKHMHAFQGRSLDAVGDYRYITIVNDETEPKLFGLDRLLRGKRIYVFEGPFDATFIPNSVATAGGDLLAATKELPRDDLVIVYDNEPRSKQTTAKIEKAIGLGADVVIWPKSFVYKDINEAIQKGSSVETCKYTIDQNTHRGLQARLAFNDWKRV
jgi:hypothetical protein